jgi:hypothetical protein
MAHSVEVNVKSVRMIYFAKNTITTGYLFVERVDSPTNFAYRINTLICVANAALDTNPFHIKIFTLIGRLNYDSSLVITEVLS